jgi:hypothetical protein
MQDAAERAARPEGDREMSERQQRVERAIRKFEQSKAQLFRNDGSPVYSEEEHQERLGALVSELHQEGEAQIEAARQQAEEYDQEALGLSYVEPTKGLSSTERERFSTSMPLIREDCEVMPLRTLVAQLRAVGVGSDRVPKLLHARYGAMRVEAEEANLAERTQNGASDTALAADAAALRQLREAVSELEGQTRDEQRAKRRVEAEEAATRNRRLAVELRRRLSEADGGAQSAREAQRSISRL